MRLGAPAFFENPDEMESLIKAYFDSCSLDKKAPNMSGLALALGFANRQSIRDYLKKPEFSCILARAILSLENDIFQRVVMDRASPAFGQFVLKCHGWKEEGQDESLNKLAEAIMILRGNEPNAIKHADISTSSGPVQDTGEQKAV